jgi:hypothetical protein
LFRAAGEGEFLGKRQDMRRRGEDWRLLVKQPCWWMMDDELLKKLWFTVKCWFKIDSNHHSSFKNDDWVNKTMWKTHGKTLGYDLLQICFFRFFTFFGIFTAGYLIWWSNNHSTNQHVDGNILGINRQNWNIVNGNIMRIYCNGV